MPRRLWARRSQRWRHDHVQRHAHSSQSQPKGSHQRRGLADAERLRQDAAQLLEFLAVAVDTATAEKCEVDDGLCQCAVQHDRPNHRVRLLADWPVESWATRAKKTQFCAPEPEFV